MPGKGFRRRFLLAALVIVAVFVVVALWLVGIFSTVQEKVLPDGSTLVLRNVSFTGTRAFLHGNPIEKILKNAIPSNGLAVSKLKLARPTVQTFPPPAGRSWLIAEFQLAGTNAQRHPLVNAAFYHQFRCVIHGERGIDFVQDFWPGSFRKYSDGYFGYILASRYPRDATWLWLKIESRERQDKGGPWSPVAEFRIRNPSPFHPETAPPVRLVTNVSVGELNFTADSITVVTQAFGDRDMWNHVVTAQFHVSSNGLPLTNWDQPYIFAEDASGNWDYNLAGHRSLDPRYVWKLEADFEPTNELPQGSILKMPLPKPGTTIITNFANIPISIFWDDYFLDASIPTNQPNVALRFVSVGDREGNEAVMGSGSWNQHGFRKGSFMWRKDGSLTMAGKPATLTLAIVTNVHATFYVQPVLKDR